MTLNVLISDDSALARKQMARALPPEWDIRLQFAVNGEEALAAAQRGQAEVLFLDLNMPVMNGYQVLEEIRRQDLPSLVLVVSGDVQPQARQWALANGALDFISKPVDREQLRAILSQFGLLNAQSPDSVRRTEQAFLGELPAPAFLEVIQEVVNVAMGQAGGRLGELLDMFIALPIPRVHRSVYTDLPTRLVFHDESTLHGASQGFSARGVSGEAILLMKSADLTRLEVPYTSLPDSSGRKTGTNARQLSALIDLSGLLAGSCLHGISEQLDLQFNHSYPVILGQGQSLDTLIGNEADGQEVLAVEVGYRLKDDIICNLLIVFTEDSIPVLEQRAAYLKQD